MDVTSVTVGLPVSDLAAARRWYEQLLEVDGPDLEPVPGLVEYRAGSAWLQLLEGPPAGDGAVVRLAVADVHAQRARLAALGVDVTEVEVVEGVVAFCDLADPDGNRLGLYAELG